MKLTGNVSDITTAAFVIQLRAGTTAASAVQPMQVKNCSLTVTATDVTQNESQNNYLLNGEFEDLAANGKPDYWHKGCGGKWNSMSAANDSKSVQLNGGACVNQFIGEPFTAQASGNAITLSCSAKNSSGYADLTLFVDGIEHKTTVPASANAEQVSVTVAPQSFKNVLAVLYGEEDVSFDNCSLTANTAVEGDWSEWLNRDTPSGLGDYEERYNFSQVCDAPTSVEARLTADPGKVFLSASDAPDSLYHLTPEKGLVCKNADQADGSCNDYQVRFFCPTSEPKLQPTLGAANLLVNPEFETTIDGWRNACPDGFAEHSNGFNGLLYTGNRSCVHHHLSEEAVAQLRGNNFEYSCTYTSSHDGVSTISTNLSDMTVPVEATLPRTYYDGNPTWKFETVSIRGRASEDLIAPNAFVMLGSRIAEGISVTDCSLKVIP